MSDEDVEAAGHAVRCYLDYCRKTLQIKIYPKLHILEKHVVPWLHTIKMGLGPVSEHGVEATHHQFNILFQKAKHMPTLRKAYEHVLHRLNIETKCRKLSLEKIEAIDRNE